MSGASLGEHADRIMTSKMPITISTQARRASGSEMPAPRNLSASATQLRTARHEFLPGMSGYPSPHGYNGVNGYPSPHGYVEGMDNAEMLPGMGAYPVTAGPYGWRGVFGLGAAPGEMLPGMGALDLRSPWLWGGVAAAVLFFTKPGKNLRKKIGFA